MKLSSQYRVTYAGGVSGPVQYDQMGYPIAQVANAKGAKGASSKLPSLVFAGSMEEAVSKVKAYLTQEKIEAEISGVTLSAGGILL